MRKSLLFPVTIVVSILLSLQAMASDSENKTSSLVSVSGQVTDNNTGEALAGVLVKIEESGNALYTDFEGRFELTDIYPGIYSINASFISYQPAKIELDLSGENNGLVKISLNQASLK